MKNKLLTILGYFVGVIGAIIISPFALVYLVIGLIWKIFASTIIAFLILLAFNATLEDCIKYSAGLGFFIGVYLKGREMSKNK